MNFRDEAVGGGNTLARAHRFAHARQFVERRLREAERAVVGGDDAAVDLHEQGFEFMAQIAHGHEARHACAALERVQRTLQRVEAIDAAAVLVPLRERALRLFDELDRFIGEDAGDVRVEIREDVFDDCSCWRSAALPAERKREVPRPPARQEPGAPETARELARRPARRRERRRRCAVRDFRWPDRCASAARCATGRNRWTRRDARRPTAWRSCNRRADSRSSASRPTPLSKDLRTQCSSGAVRRMPWRASAMRELPESVWQAR